jgi:hypothetical protein
MDEASQRSDIEIDGTAIGFEQTIGLMSLTGGGKIERHSAGPTEHLIILHYFSESWSIDDGRYESPGALSYLE